MPAAGSRLLSLPSVALIALSLASAAQARHHHRYHHEQHGFDYEDRVPPARASEPQAGGGEPQAAGFALAAAQVIHACGEQAAELQKMPFETVIGTVQPDDEQRAALEQIRAAAADATNKLNATCPRDVPARPSDQLDTMRASLDAIKGGLSPLRPAFVNVYAVLNDEQKARLVALAVSQQGASWQQGAPQSQQSAPTKPAADGEAQPISLGCRQWPAMLKSWPFNRIESDLSLSDDQHAALYTLMAAIYRAAGSVAAACHDDNALTPVARLDAELNRVDTLHQGVDTIAQAFIGFANSLNNEQAAQLNAALGALPQPATSTAR
jgi:hypothetical protein